MVIVRYVSNTNRNGIGKSNQDNNGINWKRWMFGTEDLTERGLIRGFNESPSILRRMTHLYRQGNFGRPLT